MYIFNFFLSMSIQETTRALLACKLCLIELCSHKCYTLIELCSHEKNNFYKKNLYNVIFEHTQKSKYRKIAILL